MGQKNDQPTLVGRENVLAPLVHLNGTSGAALEAQNRAARAAGRKFLEALAEAAPHGRDFYPLGSEAFGKAQKAHEARLELARRIVDELESIAFAIVSREGR